jgi:type II secretory pathway pseudopilin PulG
MTPHRTRRVQRGISLIEAVVALAVVAFGMLAYVGVQNTLRFNGDLARQRAEAVRIAQQEIERWRAMTTVPVAIDQVAFAGLLDAGAEEIDDLLNTNTTYTLTVDVSPDVDPAVRLDQPPMKTLVVDVRWTDRAGDPQSVRLATTIAAVPPELAGALSVPRALVATARPRDRHPAIPLDAVPVGSGRSAFKPEGAEGTVMWIFDDLSGVIVTVCSGGGGDCSPANAFLLSGFVRFATGEAQPLPAHAESPPGTTLPVDVIVARSFPAPAATLPCFTRLRTNGIRYFCAVPVDREPPPAGPNEFHYWAGRAYVTGGGLDWAESNTDPSAERLRACRYTPYRDDRAVGTGTPPMRNEDHPLDYGGEDPVREPRHGVRGPLTQQNFLVIRAGDGNVAFGCPDDDPSTPFVDGTTWFHPQPPRPDPPGP